MDLSPEKQAMNLSLMNKRMNKRKIHFPDEPLPDEEEVNAKRKAALETTVKVHKAYRNNEFLNSARARLIRIMCEMEEPLARLEAEGVDNIVMFFGSARAKPKPQYDEAVREAEAKLA